jgi:glyoxalase family protein
MRLDGIHHITGITADGQRCLDFYAGILGLPFLRRDTDFEAPGSHLIRLAPEPGRPDGVLSFIEAPDLGRGRPGNGMLHTVAWAVHDGSALEYWADRLAAAGIEVVASTYAGRLVEVAFADPEGIRHELHIGAPAEAGAAGVSAAVPARHAILGLLGARAYGREQGASADILAGRLGFSVAGTDLYRIGHRRPSSFALDAPPATMGRVGTGTIHHVAWACAGGLPAWRQRVVGMGCRATPAIDRGHCRSIYFREPSGILFEIAAPGAPVEAPSAPRSPRELSPNVDPRVRPTLVV